MTTIFSTLRRTDDSPASYTESHYAFLDRVAGPYWDAVRAVMESMFSGYPTEHQSRLLTRLRGRNNDDYWGAYWELVLHAVFDSLGLHPVVDPEVRIGGKTLTPDLRISDGVSTSLVEATVLHEPRQDRSEDARRAPILDMVDALTTQYHVVNIITVGASSTTPSLKRLRRSMTDWIDEVEGHPPTANEIERHTQSFNDSGWAITLELFPREPSRYGARAGIGIGTSRGRVINDHAEICKNLHKKARRYSNTHEPLVLACLNLRWTASYERWPLALLGFGWEHPEMIREGRINPTWHRVPEGLWLTRKGVRNRHVAAVVAADSLTPWSLAARSPVLWTNPWSDREAVDLGLTQHTADTTTGSLRETPGRHQIREALGLDDSWPPGEPFP